jgi:hypothetical protein
MHLNLTLKLLALTNYIELISMYDPQRGTLDHTTST